MIAGLRVAVECEECGYDGRFVYEDDCGRWLCQECAINFPCEDAEE